MNSVNLNARGSTAFRIKKIKQNKKNLKKTKEKKQIWEH